ncbi:hypothetical protein CPB86DRAFT_878456 [Serendipita vermifera]|nr:hypothetical protein CPB86DRAFT_878456 [Serendipita vermifera]
MDKIKGAKKKLYRFLVLPANTATAVARPELAQAIHPGESSVSAQVQPDGTDVALDTSITTLRAIKEAAEAIPTAGGPLKATCGVLILVLETIKRCKENREKWQELAEILEEKNQRVVSLLGLYAQAPEKYVGALEQANRYQRILNAIASDMKRETEDRSQAGEGLEQYWERMKKLGREAALSRISAGKITSYKEQLRDQALNVTEAVGIQNAKDLDQLQSLLMEQAQAKPTPVNNAALKPRPPLVEGFVGRSDILSAMYLTHFNGAPTHQQMPTMTILTGLGGSGKTQISLKFASEFEKRFPGVPVYFLDASSESALTADLQTLVRSQSNTHSDALLWLAAELKDWLIIMDNADDPTVKLTRFFPRCPHGHIIITTRNQLRKTIAPKTTYHVDSLSLEESWKLLLDSSGYEGNDANRQFAIDIVQELGCLPLAVAHAGAYILVRQCLDTYLETYRSNYSQILQREFELPQDYPYSVATTIEMSLDKLSSHVKDLIGLFSFIGARTIPRSIIEKAAKRQFRHVAFETSLPLYKNTLKHADTLMSILCPQGFWEPFDFDNLTEECEKYSLLRLSVANGERFYSMHILVQKFVQLAYSTVHGDSPSQLAIRLLGSSITLGDEYEYFAFNESLAPHIHHINPKEVIEAGDHFGFGYGYVDRISWR